MFNFVHISDIMIKEALLDIYIFGLFRKATKEIIGGDYS